MNKKKGTDFEKIVSHIESKLNPNANIDSNVFLPDLLNQPHTRECDIVITQTVGNQKFITIFEIQNRKSKVSIGDFSNFIEKQKAVGANKLIVVSKLPFVKSVIDKAKRCGPTVQLINYNEVLKDTFDVGARIISVKFIGVPQVEYGSAGHIFSENEKSEILSLMNRNEKVIQLQNEFYSIQQIFEMVKEQPISFKAGIHAYEHKIYASDGLRIRIKDNLYPLKMRISGEYEIESIEIADIYEYKPLDDDPYIFYSKGTITMDGITIEATVTYTWVEKLMCYQMSANFSEHENINIKYIGAVPSTEL